MLLQLLFGVVIADLYARGLQPLSTMLVKGLQPLSIMLFE